MENLTQMYKFLKMKRRVQFFAFLASVIISFLIPAGFLLGILILFGAMVVTDEIGYMKFDAYWPEIKRSIREQEEWSWEEKKRIAAEYDAMIKKEQKARWENIT